MNSIQITSTSTPRPNVPTQKSRLAIFGATRGIGRELMLFALEAGHPVRVLVRDRSRLDVQHPGLSVIVGDVFDDAAVARTLRSADAVFSALGAPALSDSRVRSDGTRAIIRGMKGQGIERLISVSVLGAHESRKTLPFLFRYVIFPTYLRRAVADHERQEDVVRESSLDWTLVRPPSLTDGERTGTYLHGFEGETKGLTMKVSRADVADFMLEQLASDRYVGRAAAISYQSARV